MRKKIFILSNARRISQSKTAGFTLLELLLALAVGTVVLSGAVVGIYSILVGTQRSNSQVVALANIDRAALAIKNDLLMAQTANLSASSANLTWIDYTGGSQTNHSSAYSLNVSSRELRRTYTASGNSTTSIVGRNVDSLSFTQSGNLVTVVISSNTRPPSPAKSLTFSVHLRSEALQ